MKQYFKQGKTSGGSSSQSGLMSIAGQFLGGGGKQNTSGSSSSPAAGIVGALAGTLLGAGKKTSEHQQTTDYSGAQSQRPQ